MRLIYFCDKPRKSWSIQVVFIWFATFLAQFDILIEFGLNVSVGFHKILPNAYVTPQKFYPRPPKIYTD